jgi:hypothetical protein
MMKRFLGPLDADEDKEFHNHLVLQEQVSELVTLESQIIYGAKGMGKTALRRALTELEKDAFFATGTFDIDKLSFQRLHADLDRLQETTGDEMMTLARAMWQNVIAISFLEVMCKRAPKESAFCQAVNAVLKEEQFTGRDTRNRILNQIQRFVERLGRIGMEEDTSKHYSPLEIRRMAVDRFPPTQELERLLLEARNLVKPTGKVVAICIDGFDTIVEHLPESRKIVFAGLIDAIYRLSKDPLFSDVLCVKAFLPKELTHEARSVTWDADKFLYNTIHLHWEEGNLKEFIRKRLITHSRGPKRADFDTVWHEFMPTTVRNDVHEINESSFAYILRHTQFRPRQLLYQVQMILNGWDSKSSAPFRVDSSFVPSRVAASNRTLAEHALEQLEYARTGVATFVRSFSGSTNTITYGDCFSKISRMFGAEPVENRAIFDELFDFGVIGVARRESVNRGATACKVRFVYAGEGVMKIHPNDDDIVALSPMFHDFCGCTQSHYGAVIPSTV